MTRYNTGINNKGRSIGILLPPPAAAATHNAKLVVTVILCSPFAATICRRARLRHTCLRTGAPEKSFVSGERSGFFKRPAQALEEGPACFAGKLDYNPLPARKHVTQLTVCFLFDTVSSTKS